MFGCCLIPCALFVPREVQIVSVRDAGKKMMMEFILGDGHFAVVC